MSINLIDPAQGPIGRPDRFPGRVAAMTDRLRSGGGRLALFVTTILAAIVATMAGIGWVR